MVHRTPEDSHYSEESAFPRKFSSSLSRKNSYADSLTDYYHQETFIYYRPPNKDYFEGPFSELQCQFWYKEGFFYNGLEFKLGKDAPAESLETLKERNGRECPFLDGFEKPTRGVSSELVHTMLKRVTDLAGEIEQMKEDRDKFNNAQKIERDSLQNRVKELMEKDQRNEQYRKDAEARMDQMQVEIADLQEGMANLHASTVDGDEVAAGEEEEDITVVQSHSSVFNTGAIDFPLEEDVNTAVTSSAEISEVRTELERLQSNIQSLDKFSFKLSHKVEKLKCKYKVVDIIGAGLNSENGVFDRLAYLEKSVEEIQSAMAVMDEKTKEEKTLIASSSHHSSREEIVLPQEQDGLRLSNGSSSITDEWYSPSEKFVSSSDTDALFPPIDFTAASEPIVAVATDAWPTQIEEKIVDDIVSSEKEVEDWESIDDENSEAIYDVKKSVLEITSSLEDTVVSTGDIDKENHDAKIEGGADHLELIGKGLELFLHSSVADCDDICADADIDRLLLAIKGAKMLQIAESLKLHFTKTMVCDICSTEDKKAELRNAIEYFEHLNRSHFKKCGGADKTLVNQFAYLLEQFKAAVPVPMSIAKRQYAEREKNKPWLKKEGATSPTRKTLKKKK